MAIWCAHQPENCRILPVSESCNLGILLSILFDVGKTGIDPSLRETLSNSVKIWHWDYQSYQFLWPRLLDLLQGILHASGIHRKSLNEPPSLLLYFYSKSRLKSDVAYVIPDACYLYEEWLPACWLLRLRALVGEDHHIIDGFIWRSGLAEETWTWPGIVTW